MREFTAYLKAVFLGWGQIVFTILDVLSLLILLYPGIATIINANPNTVRIIGGSVMAVCVFWANYNLFRNYFSLKPDFVNITVFRVEPYFSLELRYLSGIEPIKIQCVKAKYQNDKGEITEQVINQFFPLTDVMMAGHHFINPPALYENDGFRFHVLPNGEDLKDTDVTIEVNFIGVISKKELTSKTDYKKQNLLNTHLFVY